MSNVQSISAVPSTATSRCSAAALKEGLHRFKNTVAGMARSYGIGCLVGAGHARDRPLQRVLNGLREPLLHFVILGGLLFTADHFISGQAEDPHTLYIDATVDQQARQVFKNARGHEPDEEELYALRRVWLDNEVLYREGLALQVDKGDAAIRERVIFKALSIVDAGIKLPPFDDPLLREWFERNRAKYDEPARYDFQEAVLAGDSSEAAAQAFALALNQGAPGDAQAGLRVFKDRPHANLVQSYGPAFAEGLEHLVVGEWRALPAKDGAHVVQLESATTAQPAVFENLRGVVLQDWTDATMAAQRSAAVRALARKYTVKIDGVPVEDPFE